MTTTKYEISKFDGSNFIFWKMKMQTILLKDGCKITLQEKECKSQEMTDGQYEEKDKLAMMNLYLILDDSILFNIEVETIAKEV